MKKGFTLAEIMIALTVIGVITSILLPVAFNNVPNENVMKFKKGNATLAKVINELVTSDKYYKDGDLGVKADGSYVEESNYFCNSIADILNSKDKICKLQANVNIDTNNTGDGLITILHAIDKTDTEYWDIAKHLDSVCKTNNKNIAYNQINTIDGIIFREIDPTYPFGKVVYSDTKGCSGKAINNYYDVWDGNGYATNAEPCLHFTNGFYFVYKVFCMDVDKINNGEDPFGYAIRVDGKIILGAKAQEWLEKSIQEKE